MILNRVGSSRHEQVLTAACESVGVPVLGAVPRHDALSVPSRHLGLVTAVERGAAARSAVDAMAALAERHVDLAAVRAMARSSVTVPPWSPHDAIGAGPASARPVVAVAAGPAFSFGYAERDELLRAAGADVVTFDPLCDALPPGARALVLPGGFPEEYTGELSANSTLREQIAVFAAANPVHAECGGLTYLMDHLDGVPMCGVLAGSARFTERLTIGYRDAVAAADSTLFSTGERVVGHEFHRTAVEFTDSVQPAWLLAGRTGDQDSDGAVRGGLHAGYLHTHPAAHPNAVRRFVELATI